MGKSGIWRYAAVFWFLGVGFLLLAPLESMGTSTIDWSLGLSLPHLDKLIHIFLFFVLAALLHQVFLSWNGEGRAIFPMPAWFLAILGATFYGVFLEAVQAFLPYRTAELADVLADIVGSCVYALAAWAKNRSVVFEV